MDSSKIHHFDDLFDTSVFNIPKGSIDFDGDGSFRYRFGSSSSWSLIALNHTFWLMKDGSIHPKSQLYSCVFFLCVISLMRHWMKLVIRKIFQINLYAAWSNKTSSHVDT